MELSRCVKEGRLWGPYVHVSLRGRCFFHCLVLPHAVLYRLVFCKPYHTVLYSMILHHITSCIPHHITLYHITLRHTVSYCTEAFIIPCVLYPISLHVASLCCKTRFSLSHGKGLISKETASVGGMCLRLFCRGCY